MLVVNEKVARILVRYAIDYGTPFKIENGKLIMFDYEEVTYNEI